MMPVLVQIGSVMSVALAAVLAASDATPWLELVRDGYEAQREEIHEVVAEGTRTFSLTTRTSGHEQSFREQYRVRWYQSGDRLRYEHRIVASNRAGYDTAESWDRVGRDIHLVLPDAHILHYESDGTTLVFDRDDWQHRTEGLLRYLAVDGSKDAASYSAWLLAKETGGSGRDGWVYEVNRQDQPGGAEVELRRTYRTSEREALHAVWVDPLRGFYPVRHEKTVTVQTNGVAPMTNEVRCEVVPTSVGSENWFPVRCLRVDLSNGPGTFQESKDSWEFNRLEVNQGLLKGRDDLFSIHSLGLEDGGLVIDQRASQGYLTGQTLFTYGRFKITDFDLRGYLGNLGRAMDREFATERASRVGDAETFLWDEESRLYLSREPLCSVFSLWLILGIEDRPRQLDQVFALFPNVTPHGVSAKQLASAAAAADLPCEVVKLEVEGLRRLLDRSTRPVVLHLDGQHFATAVATRSEGVLVADFPEVKLLSWASLRKSWTGNALVFDPESLAAGGWARGVFAWSGIVCGVVAVFLPIYRWRWNRQRP
jgi:hypothetical protein